MPYKCCVPGCRGNFINGPKVKVFSFPKEAALRNEWLINIKKKDFQPSKHSRVCELHFFESDIQKEVSMLDFKTGKIVSAPLCHPKLNRNAVPSIFPVMSSHTTMKEKKLNVKKVKSQSPLQKISDNVPDDDIEIIPIETETELLDLTDDKDNASEKQQISVSSAGSIADDDLETASQNFLTAIENLEKRTSVLEEQMKKLISSIS